MAVASFKQARIPADDSDQRDAFTRHESDVRSYCRKFPSVYVSASSATIVDEDGREYIDFLSGAGALNYGHNPEPIKRAVVRYLCDNGILHALDLYTAAKRDFIQAFHETVLQPRGLHYKLAFPGPTGTNAVELAVKFARQVTKRETVVAFTNAYHGVSLGSLALTGNRSKRAAAGICLPGVARLPYDGYLGDGFDTAALFERFLDDEGSGIDMPAAVIVETVQGEGGLNSCSPQWLRRICETARRHGVVTIVDDIQVGCGRTGTFFSFEGAGIDPDVVCLSKSLSGIGQPFSLVLLKPELDCLPPGAHDGTFRGNNLAFVSARAALRYWSDPLFQSCLERLCRALPDRLDAIARRFSELHTRVVGRGAILGLTWPDATMADRVSAAAFERGLIIETCGARDEVLKLLPPLTIRGDELDSGLEKLQGAIADAARHARALIARG
ncbi:MAG: diaminobutyrate--2-oxoglutarate transaminase [Acidiferrobacterales bacterium]